MAVGRDSVFLPPGAVGVGGQGMKRGSDLTQKCPLYNEEEVGLLKVEGWLW